MKNAIISVFLLLTVFTLSISGNIEFEPEGWVLTDKTGIDTCIDTKITVNRDKTYSVNIKFNEKKSELSETDKNDFKDYPVTLYRRIKVKDGKDPSDYTIVLKEIEKYTVDVSDTRTSTINVQPLKEIHDVVIKIGKESIWYNWTTNIITLTGEGLGTPGGDWDNAYGFDDLYDADQAGGWGVIVKVSQMHPDECLAYKIDAFIIIGNTTNDCYFKDSRKSIIVERDHTIVPYVGFLEVIDNRGHLEFGEGNITHKRGVSGVNFVSYIRHDSRRGKKNFIRGKDINLYGCNFQSLSSGGYYKRVYAITGINGNIFDCSFHQWYSAIAYAQSNLSINQMLVSNCVSAFRACNESITLNNINIHESTHTFYTGNLTIRNGGFTDCVYLVFCSEPSYINLIDCELEKDNFIDFGYMHHIYQIYSFNLKTTPEAQIIITSNETVLFNNYSSLNGTIPEQLFTVFITHSNIQYIDNNPYTITIEKEGYEPYTQDFNITKPFDCQINLIEIPFCDQFNCLSVSMVILFIGLMFLSLHKKSPLISLLTGLMLVYLALSYTQTDKIASLILTGFALVMIAYCALFSRDGGGSTV